MLTPVGVPIKGEVLNSKVASESVRSGNRVPSKPCWGKQVGCNVCKEMHRLFRAECQNGKGVQSCTTLQMFGMEAKRRITSNVSRKLLNINSI